MWLICSFLSLSYLFSPAALVFNEPWETPGMFCRSFSITCCFNNASPRSALAASCCRYPDFEWEEIFVFAVNLRICKSSMHKLQHNELSVIRSFQLSFRWLGVCLVVFFSSLANLHCELRYWKCEMIVCRLRCLDNLRYLKAFSTFTIKTPFVHGDMRLQYLPSSPSMVQDTVD